MKIRELITRLLEEDMNAEIFVATTDKSKMDKTSTKENNVFFKINYVEHWGNNAYISFKDWRESEVSDADSD